MMTETPTVEYRNLHVTYANGCHAVRGVSFEVKRGECLALVGESGCGKTTMALAALGLLSDSAEITGEIVVGNTEVVSADAVALRSLRGNEAGFVVQDPYSACNKLARIESHIAEAWRAKRMKVDKDEMVSRIENLGINNAASALRKYPHQWSGGMLQRGTIAAASIHHPKLLVADEPTSALDADRADSTLEVLKRTEASILLITHDIETVMRHADRIAICYAGKIVEIGDNRTILLSPRHPYTRGLLNAIPDTNGRFIPQPMDGNPPDLRLPVRGCAFARRCELCGRLCLREEPKPANGIACHFAQSLETGRATRDRRIIHIPDEIRIKSSALIQVQEVSKVYRHHGHEVKAVRSASLDIYPGEIIGISGPSGCGKSTLLRMLMELESPDNGEIRFRKGVETTSFAMPIFQDPVSSLDSRWPIWKTITEPLTAPYRTKRYSRSQRKDLASHYLRKVRLETLDLETRPGELSVGQCQRISIARALASSPRLIFADEPTSALDASVSAGILHLLADFAEEGGALVVVSHDRSLINVLSSRLYEMEEGKLQKA